MTRLDLTNDIFMVISFSDLRSLLKLFKVWEPLILELETTLQPPDQIYAAASDKDYGKEKESTPPDLVLLIVGGFI